uniref:Uncharacterized protein n=1 Tax=Kalanchoe fedtschenkoi TaxID=63787 RepID=A0A7N0TQX9_KALFE
MYSKIKIEREKSQIKPHYYLLTPHVNEFNVNTSESREYISSSNRDAKEYSYAGNELKSHPIGQKAAKRKLKERGHKNVTESVNAKFEHRWKRLEELQAYELIILNEIMNKANDDTLRVDYEILMKNKIAMSDQQLVIHNHMSSIIKS